jgi:hypothetical protein
MNTRTIEMITSEINNGKASMELLSNALVGLEGKELSNAKGKLTKASNLVVALETELAGLVEQERVKALAPKPSKVARIDQLYIEAAKANQGNLGKEVANNILTIIKSEYPGINEVSTMKTIRCRPWHIRQAILNGKLKEVVLNKRVAAVVV